jgi:hypothetical protein
MTYLHVERIEINDFQRVIKKISILDAILHPRC